MTRKQYLRQIIKENKEIIDGGIRDGFTDTKTIKELTQTNAHLKSEIKNL